jgi:CDP-6-deoxy-D-xylo-4-hexulose-3-dehydrase
VTIQYPLASSSWNDEELEAIKTVTATGMFTMGEHVRKFEEEFAAYTGSKYCIMVNSGSSANLLAIAALFYRAKGALKAGDEVIVPAVSWATTYYPLSQYGLKLKFVDIDPDTLNFDLTALADAVTDFTRLIFAVNLLGNSNDFDAIGKIIGDRQITIVEDNCESMGATFKDKQCGTFGVMGTFSTFFSHHMSTMEGGLIVTDDEELYQILKSTRSHGWTRGLPQKNHIIGELSDDPFFESFRFVLPGYNLRPIEFSGAIGSCQLRKLPSFIEARRHNAVLFQELFGNDTRFSIQQEIGESSWFGFALTVTERAGFDRKHVVDALRQAGIECRPVVAGNFTRNPVIKWMSHEIHGTLRHADRVHEHGLFVGNHQFPIDDHIRLLKQTLAKLS